MLSTRYTTSTPRTSGYSSRILRARLPSTAMEAILAALAEQQAETDSILAGLDEADWAKPTLPWPVSG